MSYLDVILRSSPKNVSHDWILGRSRDVPANDKESGSVRDEQQQCAASLRATSPLARQWFGQRQQQTSASNI
jgi:hypothetical protein